MLVIAHRGGLWPETAENTLDAFLTAAEAGVDWIETDVHASADGVLYAVHDPDLRRLAGIGAALEDLPARELDAISLTAGGGLPRLADVLAAVPDVPFNIDVKADSAVVPTIRLLRTLQAERRLRLASFSSRRLAALRSALPGVATSAGTAEIAVLKFTRFRALDHLSASIDAVQVPVRYGPVRVVTQDFVSAAHRAGLQVHVWTVNDLAEAHRLAALGVDGLVTDVPTALLGAGLGRE